MSTIEPAQAPELGRRCGSSVSSIENWLDDHPNDPADYKRETVSGKKRERGIQHHSVRPHKRHKLIELSNNAMASPEPRATRASRRRGRASLGKKAGQPVDQQVSSNPLLEQSVDEVSLITQQKASEPSTPKTQRVPADKEIDADPTPKANANPFKFRPTFPIPLQDNQQPSSPASSALTLDSRSTSSSKRSKSPSKQDTDLQLSDVAVEWVTFGTPGRSLPDEARVLLKSLPSIGDNWRVIPGVVKRRIIEYIVNTDSKDLDEKKIDHWFTAQEGSKATLAASEYSLDEDITPEAELDMVIRIKQATFECRNDDVSEAQWNSAVHFPLLDLALRRYWRSKGIWFYDITTAKISNSSLLPGIASKAKKMQSKMVDYAMVLRPSGDLLKRIRIKLRAEERFSINQTDARYVRFTPITLSIETKRAAIEEDSANTQLATWVSAHFTNLEQLTVDGSGPPILPLLMVQGREWDFCVAQKLNDEIVIFRDHKLGSTGSIVGVYQLLAAIRRLAKWSDENYREWFESHVL